MIDPHSSQIFWDGSGPWLAAGRSRSVRRWSENAMALTSTALIAPALTSTASTSPASDSGPRTATNGAHSVPDELRTDAVNSNGWRTFAEEQNFDGTRMSFDGIPRGANFDHSTGRLGMMNGSRRIEPRARILALGLKLGPR